MRQIMQHPREQLQRRHLIISFNIENPEHRRRI